MCLVPVCKSLVAIVVVLKICLLSAVFLCNFFEVCDYAAEKIYNFIISIETPPCLGLELLTSRPAPALLVGTSSTAVRVD